MLELQGGSGLPCFFCVHAPVFYSGAGLGIMVASISDPVGSCHMNRIIALICASLLTLGLAACGDKDASTPASQASIERQTSDPAAAIEAFAAKLREDRLLEAVQLVVPPENLDQLRTEWKKKLDSEPPSDEDRAEYAETMKKLTAADAEAQLYAEVEPLLIKFETEIAAQLPMFVIMGQGFLTQAINENDDLNANQKKQAIDAVGALGGWLQSANLADRDLAKRGIGIAVKTARNLDLPTLDAVHSLDFDQSMAKTGMAFGGMKEILALYGFDLNQTLASIKAKETSREDGVATVAVDFSLLGKPMSTETEMVERDGRWYGKDTIESLTRDLIGIQAADGKVVDKDASSLAQ